MTARTKPLSPKFIEKLVLGCSENIRSEHKTRSENKTLKGGGARLLDLETQMEIFEPIGDEAEGPPCNGCKSGPQESHEVVGGCQGWETTIDHATRYDTLDGLLRADPRAKVIESNWGDLIALFPFLEK